jgi:hypothetical protein
MKKIKLNIYCLIKKFKEHNKYKKQLLSLFNEQKSKTGTTNLSMLNSQDNLYQYQDSINKLDWSNSKNFNRDWVNLIKVDLHKHFISCAKEFNFDRVQIDDLWFQQYVKGDFHGWHIHGSNYTGVYYVNFKDKYAQTKLVDPITNKIITVKAKEGDIIIFPSFIIHCSPIQKVNKTKTIISFNLTFDGIKKEHISNLSKKI